MLNLSEKPGYAASESVKTFPIYEIRGSHPYSHVVRKHMKF